MQALLNIQRQLVEVREMEKTDLIPFNHLPGAHMEHLITIFFCFTEETVGEFSVGLPMETQQANLQSSPSARAPSLVLTHWPWSRYILSSLQEVGFEITPQT